MFEFIKAVSDAAQGIINAAYCDKHFIFIRATFQEMLVSHDQAADIN